MANPISLSEKLLSFFPRNARLKLPCGIVLMLLFFTIFSELFSATSDSLFIYADSLDHNIAINGVWRYRAGDDSTWAEPDFDVSSWDTLRPEMRMDSLKEGIWKGIGWFRKVLVVDSTLWGKMVALRVDHYGASEIYLNGDLVQTYGNVSALPDSERIRQPVRIPFAVTLDSARTQLLAVRYSNQQAVERDKWYYKWFRRAGFRMQIAPLNETISSVVHSEKMNYGINFAIAGLFLSLALLYASLFIVFSRRKENLFYALFTLFICLIFISNMMLRFPASSLTFYHIFDVILSLIFSLIFLSYLGFLYSIFYKRFPRQLWLFLAVAAVISVSIFTYLPINFINYLLFAFILVATLEGLRVILIALKQKKKNAWVIGAGVIVFACFIITLFVLGFFNQNTNNAWGLVIVLIGLFSLPMSMSVYLARDIAFTNKNLESQLKTVQELTQKQIEQERRNAELRLQTELIESENRRKTKELEEARRLQLSMLPRTVPKLSGLEIAAYMNPATEVGGDYYDFYLAGDGTLTVAVGDATGHGLNAGMMVTAAKSLFEALANEPDTVKIMNQSNRIIRQMNFATLKMAICFLKVRDNKLWASSAGMPPILIFHKAAQELEEINCEGMPLGSLAKFPYQSIKRTLFPGDKIVLMSDGFPERQNSAGEMLDYPAAYQAILDRANKSPQELVEALVAKGDEWASGRPQDDDVTFVVIEVK